MSEPSLDLSKARPPALPPATMIQTAEALQELTDRLYAADALAVDTEFVRERTYYPGLGLIQIADGSDAFLIDPVAIEDLEPLRRVFADPDVVKVLHSPSEDMEVFYHRFGEVPAPLFDTQIAAALVGMGYSLGYHRLIVELFGIDLPKGQTRTNWLRRPLREAQLEYAALDVAHLLPSYDVLRHALEASGRHDWAQEEFAAYGDTERFELDPETVYLGTKGLRHVSGDALTIFRDLAAWREREARRRDLPRNFVVPEASLSRIAQTNPRSPRELKKIRELRDQDARRHGDAILEIVERALDADPAERPPQPPTPIDLRDHRDVVEELRQAVRDRAEELDLPPELLATRRTVENLVRRHLEGQDEPLPRELRGWRREAIGEGLLARMHHFLLSSLKNG